MVPIYSLSSLASITSLEGAFFIDLVRDIYEAFVIYCFFALLVEYLGGERSLLILAHGRAPTKHPFPFNLLFQPMDVSDPYTFLALKRGILQYVQVKPVLAVATVFLKITGHYEEGKLSWTNGYTYVSFVYNFSVFLSLCALAMFWACLSEDLAPFRVTSKFLCIKGIIFFSFWQGLAVSILVAAGAITNIGPISDQAKLALAIQDMLVSFEMPLFALGHAYAFSPRDYVDPFAHYAARLPALYALRDATGGYDVLSDSVGTLSGKGYGYQTFEPSEGVVHQGLGRIRRSKAGLRYTQGGKGKYWLPQWAAVDGSLDGPLGTRHRGPATAFKQWLDHRVMAREGYAPLLETEAEDIVHPDPDASKPGDGPGEGGDEAGPSRINPRAAASAAVARAEQTWHRLHPDAEADNSTLEFDEPQMDADLEKLFTESRNLRHGDYAYPTVDVGMEEQRRRSRERDDQAIKRHKQRKDQKSKVGKVMDDESQQAKRASQASQDTAADYGATGESSEQTHTESDAPKKESKGWFWSRKPKKAKPSDEEEGPPQGIVDIFVQDREAEERQRLRERRRGDPALRAGHHTRIFRRQWEGHAEVHSSDSEVSSPPPSAVDDSASQDTVQPSEPVGSKRKERGPKQQPFDHVRVAEETAAEAEMQAHPEAESVGKDGDASDPKGSIIAADTGKNDVVSRETALPRLSKGH
ncbi:Predicted seven transmembrane receptor-rhodopsin family [Ceraceosorus bombacis]|uniref:Predicted seven transmembrane receptor-rhodopsin family n=1 Tax=Ceraceosorus bombacis TaxID=401625 RepID=A0A0P1BR62_9BASI|nr:Predicted seven transmembrane receptor-rhodopsin family [Ceraceosorus bombacis]